MIKDLLAAAGLVVIVKKGYQCWRLYDEMCKKASKCGHCVWSPTDGQTEKEAESS